MKIKAPPFEKFRTAFQAGNVPAAWRPFIWTRDQLNRIKPELAPEGLAKQKLCRARLSADGVTPVVSTVYRPVKGFPCVLPLEKYLTP